MSETNALQDIERRAWTFNHQDGLWDIFLGLVFLGCGLRGLSDSLWFYLLVAAAVLALLVGKRFVTLPRIGLINFGSRRKARINIVRVAVLAAVIFTAGVITMMAVTSNGISGDFLGWIFVLLVPGVFLLMAYLLDFNRLYGYTVPIAGFMVFAEFFGDPTGAWAQIVAGFIPLTVGTVLFGRFLRDYPIVDHETQTESRTNGLS